MNRAGNKETKHGTHLHIDVLRYPMRCANQDHFDDSHYPNYSFL